MNEINETIAGVYEKETKNEDDDSDKNEPLKHSDESETKEADEEGIDCRKEGQMLVDATCAPADIQFPTDIRLLNEGREKQKASFFDTSAGI